MDGIRALNDNFRRTFTGGLVLVTPGIEDLCAEVKAEVLCRVRTFDRFDDANDPWGEHDLGIFDIAGLTFMWQISCYDRTIQYASDDPADPQKTTRVLTIMLAEER